MEREGTSARRGTRVPGEGTERAGEGIRRAAGLAKAGKAHQGARERANGRAE